jgi:hypothetical protein
MAARKADGLSLEQLREKDLSALSSFFEKFEERVPDYSYEGLAGLSTLEFNEQFINALFVTADIIVDSFTEGPKTQFKILSNVPAFDTNRLVTVDQLTEILSFHLLEKLRDPEEQEELNTLRKYLLYGVIRFVTAGLKNINNDELSPAEIAALKEIIKIRTVIITKFDYPGKFNSFICNLIVRGVQIFEDLPDNQTIIKDCYQGAAALNKLHLVDYKISFIKFSKLLVYSTRNPDHYAQSFLLELDKITTTDEKIAFEQATSAIRRIKSIFRTTVVLKQVSALETRETMKSIPLSYPGDKFNDTICEMSEIPEILLTHQTMLYVENLTEELVIRVIESLREKLTAKYSEFNDKRFTLPDEAYGDALQAKFYIEEYYKKEIDTNVSLKMQPFENFAWSLLNHFTQLDAYILKINQGPIRTSGFEAFQILENSRKNIIIQLLSRFSPGRVPDYSQPLFNGSERDAIIEINRVRSEAKKSGDASSLLESSDTESAEFLDSDQLRSDSDESKPEIGEATPRKKRTSRRGRGRKRGSKAGE